MNRCFITFPHAESKLLPELKARFRKGEAAEYIYDNIVASNSMEPHSFNSWLNTKQDVLLYDNGEVHIDEFNEWINYINKKSKLERSFVTDKINIGVQDFTAIAEGVTVNLAEALREKGISFNEIIDGDSININNIINQALLKTTNTLQSLINESRNNPDSQNPPERLNYIELAINEINNNQNIFQNAYNNYLKATLGITIKSNSINFGEESSILNEDQQYIDDKVTKDTPSYISSIEFDTKASAPRAIKLLIGSLQKGEETNSLGLPKPIEYTDTFNFLHETLAPLKPDIEIYIEELKKHVTKRPEIKNLIDILNFDKPTFFYDSNEAKAQEEQQLRTQFVNQFNKTKYGYSIHIKDETGKIKVIDANLDKMQNIRLIEWENNFKYLISVNRKTYSLEGFEKTIKKLNDQDLLKAVGITSEHLFNEKLFRSPKEYRRYLSAMTDDIRKYGMNSWEDFKTIYNRKSAKGGGVRSKLLALAKRDVELNDETVELQHYNPDGKLVYDISLNTYLSSRVKELAYYKGNSTALEEMFPEIFNDPYSANSRFLAWVKAGEEIQIGISTGFKNDTNRNSSGTNELNEKDLTLQKIMNVVQEGTYNFLRAGGRKVENIISFEGRRLREGLVVQSRESMVTYLINHLIDEVTANQYYKEMGINVSGLSSIDPNTTRVFTLENGENLIEKIGYDKLIETDFNSWKYELPPTVQKFINKKIDEIIATEKAFIEKQGIVEQDIMNEILEKEYGSYNTVIELFALNGFAGNLELTKVFTGDPVLYENSANFFKRMSMLNSTKEGTRVDAEMNTHIESLTNNLEVAQGYMGGRQGSSIQTITANDVIESREDLTKEERDLLNEVLEETKAKAYDNINTADGFAYITYDEYRIMKKRYSDWTKHDEALYQKLTTEKNPVITENDYHMILPDKSQFVGKIQNEGLTDYNLVAGRKFSFLPLIPGMFKQDSTLDKLNNLMLSKGIGMAFMQSASKFGNSKAIDIYDENGINATDENIDVLDYSNIGNQLKINKIPKTEQTESSQKRKLNLSNFFENGEIAKSKDPELSSKINKYTAIQKEKIQRAYNVLKDKMGIDANPGMQVQTFVNSLINIGSLQGFTTNELLALNELINLPYLDILPNKQRVESFIMAKLKNSTINQKRTGASMAQASNLGFEVAEGMNRKDLKFYRKSKRGDLLPMEVYAPLPKELMNYVAIKYNKTGKGLTQAALDAFNYDVAEDNKNYEETGEMTNLTKMTMLIGFRIPNQDSSSSDVGKVKSYYMPHVGSIVVVPKALVVKTGSDFDIDKLNMYLPEVDIEYDKEYRIARDFINKHKKKGYVLIDELKKEEIGYDYENQSKGTIERWFIKGILQKSPSQLNDPWNMVLSHEYQSVVKQKQSDSININYISAEPDTALEDMTDEELNNAALENEIELTLTEDNWKQLLTPLDTNNLKNISKTINKLRGIKKEDSLSDIFLPSYNTTKMMEFSSGGAGTGIVAVHNTNHVESQKAGLTMPATHNYFGKDLLLEEPKTAVEDKMPEETEKDINELVDKPIIQLDFLNQDEILKLANKIQARRDQKKIEKRAENLQEMIDCIWKG